MNTTVVCATCCKEFSDPKHSNRKYCSLTCSTEAQKRRIELVCEGCGKTFVVREKHAQRKFCSTGCRDKYQYRPDTGKEIRTCEYCGKEFRAWAYRNRRFCSTACKNEARVSKARVVLICAHCGKPYTTTRFFTTKRKSKYCSNDCRAQGNSLIKRGAGNPNYRGGTIEYRGRNWGSQRRKAIKRDGSRCQICKHTIVRKTGCFGVHHIKPFREFNGDWESANQLTNLITLCSSCHAKVEFGELACPIPLL